MHYVIKSIYKFPLARQAAIPKPKWIKCGCENRLEYLLASLVQDGARGRIVKISDTTAKRLTWSQLPRVACIVWTLRRVC
jgi:hypothetical protein